MFRFIAILLLICISTSFAAEPSYIGSDKCKICHKKEEKGAQYQKWTAGPHASSYETLLTEESKAIAAKMGISSPETSAECLSCHVTGWGHASGYQLEVDPADSRAVKKNKDLARVGCESCHGAGKLYKSKSKMEQIYLGELDGAPLGLIEPDEANCVSCHNEKSPTYKPFDYATRVKEVLHPYPEGYTIPQD